LIRLRFTHSHIVTLTHTLSPLVHTHSPHCHSLVGAHTRSDATSQVPPLKSAAPLPQSEFPRGRDRPAISLPPSRLPHPPDLEARCGGGVQGGKGVTCIRATRLRGDSPHSRRSAPLPPCGVGRSVSLGKGARRSVRRWHPVHAGHRGGVGAMYSPFPLPTALGSSKLEA